MDAAAPGAKRARTGEGSQTARKPRRRGRRPQPGSLPGRLIVPKDAPPLEIFALSYDADHLEERSLCTPDDLKPLLESKRPLWVDVHGLGDESLLERLREVLGLHPLAMADVVNVPQRPKVERYGDLILTILQTANTMPDGDIDMDQVSLVLGPSWVCSFQEKASEVFAPVRERICSHVGLIRKMGTDYLLYALLDAIMDGYFPVVEALGERLDALEEEVVARPDRRSLSRIHRIRRMLIQLHRVQWGQRDALSGLLRDEDLPISPTVRVYIRDVQDHAIQVLDLVETQREIGVGLMDIYLSSISNRMNEIMKTLTIIGSIFIPLTFIVGIYGMNFEYMPELTWHWGYFGVWCVMIVTTIGMLIWFRRRGWLERAPKPEFEEHGKD